MIKWLILIVIAVVFVFALSCCIVAGRAGDLSGGSHG